MRSLPATPLEGLSDNAGSRFGGEDLRGSSALVFCLGELHLDAVDAVHAVDEEDEDEDECDLQLVNIVSQSVDH